MTAHIRERVLLLASDERDILRLERREQDRVTATIGALSARGWRCYSVQSARRI